MFLAGLVAGLCVGAGGMAVWSVHLVSRLFETHRQTVAQALSSERILKMANDPTRQRPSPQRPKSDIEKMLEARKEMDEWERKMFGG